MYWIVLFSHVLGAIVSVGPAITSGIRIALTRRASTREGAFAFRAILMVPKLA